MAEAKERLRIPIKERGRSAKAARLQTSDNPMILLRHSAAVNPATRARWKQEGDRLLAEFQRTRNPAHLRAFRGHRAAMAVRFRERVVAE